MALTGCDMSERADVRYSRNLAALSRRQPEVAKAVDTAPIPHTVKTATGRDSSPTYLIATESERSTWFGQSSMPTISAEGLLSGSYGNDGNVSLPGVFTGREPLIIARKMPPHTALFVIEQNPLNLKLAMHLHRYDELLLAGRLVFILGAGDAMIEDMGTFFEQHPGYEWPGQMLTMPQLSAPAIADLQHQLVQAADVVARVQAQVMESHARSLQARRWGPVPQRPRVALLSRDPRPVSLEQVQRVGRALTTLALPHEVCVPDVPDNCNMAARMAAIARLNADLVFLINSRPGAMRSALPDRLPVVCWYGPEAMVEPLNGPSWSESHLVFAASCATRDALVAAGVPAGSVHICGPGADETVFRPLTLTPDGDDALDLDVAVLMDVPDDRPEACGIDLASHVSLWQALTKAVTRQADAYQHDLAENLLEDGQRRSGTALRDAKVRARFLSLIRTRIAPAVLARVAVKALLRKGYRVGVWGRNWPALDSDRDPRQGPIPSGDALNRVLNAARSVVSPDPSTAFVQTAIDVVTAGTPVVCRCPKDMLEREYPDLVDLAPYMSFYVTSDQLLDVVGAAVERDQSALRALQAARSLVLARHTFAHRVRSIIETVRGGVEPAEQRLCGPS